MIPAEKTKDQLEQELLGLLEDQEQDLKYNKIDYLYPDHGEYRRELYPKFIKHFDAGATYSQRAMIAANRTGKTTAAMVELVYHMTGKYPKWWRGKKFLNPVSCWAASKTNQMTKEVMQMALIGPLLEKGSGLIPKDLIVDVNKKHGIPDAIETIFVRHISGGISECTFKSYDQGRESFQGTYKHVICLDEEPSDIGIYSECLTRTMNKVNPGILIITFTPLLGLSDIVLSFLPGGAHPRNGIVADGSGRYVTQIVWDDVPHLDEEQKAQILITYSPHERAARSRGVPSLGSGAIYPYPEDEVFIPPIPVQSWWPKAYGLDVGWNKTAAVWIALDPDSQIFYLYSEHYVGETLPVLHASAIKARGEWIIGAIDPASTGGSQADGKVLYDIYSNEGLRLELATNAVEAGILKVGQLIASGRLKIFNSCVNILEEYRVYRRDEKGQVVKKKDHALDALRYVMVTWDDIASCYSENYNETAGTGADHTHRNSITGY